MSTRCCSRSSPGAVLSLGLGQYLHMRVLISSLLNTGGGSSAILYAARSSPLLSPVSCLHPAGLLVLFLVNRHNRLCLVLLSMPSTRNFQVISWGPPHLFPIIQNSSSFPAWCYLEIHCFTFFLDLFLFFVSGGKLGLCYFILDEIKSSDCRLLPSFSSPDWCYLGFTLRQKVTKIGKIIQCDSLLPFVDATPISVYIWLFSSPFKCNYLKNFLRV